MPKRNPRRTDKEWLDLIQESQNIGVRPYEVPIK
mgnify:CR=1 FL=1